MKLEYLTGYLNENQINTGLLDIYYDFSGISGFFVPNRLYANQNQFNQVGGGYTVNNQYYPGIFISCYQETGFTGSGIFEGKNTLKAINELSGDNFSLFYNFGALSCNKDFTIGAKNIKEPTGYIQVLSYIESKNQENPFEIILGLNDAKKMTLEFSGSTGSLTEIYKSTNFAELAFQNITTLKVNLQNIECSYLDIIEDEIHEKIINVTGLYFNQEKNIYIGNIPTGKYRPGYTGFIGNVQDFIAFNGYFNSNFCLDLAKNFVKTGETINIIDISGVRYNSIRSGFLNPTGIIGVGITGYQMVPSTDIINSSCGQTCTIYINSGITGYITGEKIEYITVGQEEYTLHQKQIKSNIYDQNLAVNFTKNYIVFTPALSDLDIFDINLYKDIGNRIEQPDYSTLNKIYISQDNLSNKDRLILFNGVNIETGSYVINNINDKRFTINAYDKDENDLVLYSISDFASKYLNIFYDQSSFKSGNYIFAYQFINTSPLIDKPNIFLNGQKLISGLDFILPQSGSNKNLYLKNDLTSGMLSLITDNYIKTNLTGSNIKLYIPNEIYNNERIWLNGVFQNKNENYILTSCFNTILHGTGEIPGQSESIFSNEYNRFV